MITVHDLDTTCEFYARVFAMEVVTFGEDRNALKFGQQKINLHAVGEEFEPKALYPSTGDSASRPFLVWASYGDYDRRQFERQCLSRNISYPFGSRHINVKSLLAIIQVLPQEVGMAQALELLNIPLEGTHHGGGDDAWNIAVILGKLILKTRDKQ